MHTQVLSKQCCCSSSQDPLEEQQLAEAISSLQGQSQAVSEDLTQKIVSIMLIHIRYSDWPHHCCWQSAHMYVTSQLQSTSNGNQREDKSTQNSTTDVSFCKIIICLSQCTTAITVYSESY